jgi:hypothetical protein
MYSRMTQRRNRDGSVVRYVQVAHNRRVDGVTRAEVLINLGREDRRDAEGLRRLVGSISRYLGEPDAGTGDAAGQTREPAGIERPDRPGPGSPRCRARRRCDTNSGTSRRASQLVS